LWSALCAAFFFACGTKDRGTTGNEQSPILASAYDNQLRLSDIYQIIPSNISPEDSLQIIRSYTEDWVRDQLIQREAVKNIKDLSKIEKLVDDYKNSLIMFEYQQLLVRNLLDSTITEEEMNIQYQKEKEQFILEYPLYRYRLLAIDANSDNYYELRTMWNNRDEGDTADSLAKYCSPPGCMFIVNDSEWVRREQISSYFPSSVNWEARLDEKGEYTYWGDEQRVLLSISESLESGEHAPLPYIMDQLKVLILHDRTRLLFEEVRNDLYEKAVEKNAIKFYIK
jgi:hypothetical protein